MKIGVQIVLYKNEIEEIRRSLNALKASQLQNNTELAIYIGDNSCDKNYHHRVKKIVSEFSQALEIEFIFSNDNLGHGQMHNKLFSISQSKVDYILIINPDGAISPHAIFLMSQKLEDQKVGAVETRQLPLEHPKKFDLITGETSWISGACALIRADIFRELNGFDPRFFLHGDDVDLSWRIRNLGYKLVYEANAMFFHSKNLDTNGYPEQSKSERFYGPLGGLLIAHKFGLKKGLKMMLADLKVSSDPIHGSILKEFEMISSIYFPIQINKSIPQYHHPWKFSATRY